MKTCTKCGEAKEDSAYPKSNGKPRAMCRTCFYALQKKSHDKNRAKRTAAVKRWKLANPEKHRAHVRKRNQNRARAPGGFFDMNRADYQKRYELYGWQCAFCFTPGVETADHLIALGVGGNNWPCNIVPCCHKCNLLKHTKKPGKSWPYPKLPGPLTPLP